MFHFFLTSLFSPFRRESVSFAGLLCFVCGTSPLFAAQIVLKDGRVLEGRIAPISRVDEKADEAGKAPATLIVVLDDGLRRVYFPKYNIMPGNPPEAGGEVFEIFKTDLRFQRGGQALAVLGEYDNSTPFDMFGRRILPLKSPGGTQLAIQAITELTPKYVRARALQIDKIPTEWDMRIATNSIPREVLTPILMNLINPKELEDRIRLVRFYIQGNLYEDAFDEIDAIRNDWNDDPDVKQRLASYYRAISHRRYERRINELEFRWKAGQFAMVKKFLAELENDEGLPEQLFQQVRRMGLRFDDFEKKRVDTITTLHNLYTNLPDDEKNEKIPPILDEIDANLSLTTLDRLATFHLYAKNKEFSDAEKIALAATGWFAGPTAENRRLSVAATLPETRELVVQYMKTGPDDSAQRQVVLAKLRTLEAGRPDLVAGILAHIDPPKESPPGDPERPGYYPFEVDSPIEGAVPRFQYVVQLPPEYDPKRRYPMIVTLNGLTKTPDQQLDWWAGTWKGAERYGQAGRQGYIVIAPNWNPAMLLDYDFSAFAHAAVLYSTKDALRRFNIDTDRVFLSGHGVGGTAAWDIGVAHPDLWAGVVPFNAVASQYIKTYVANARHVPLYLVSGELEGSTNTLSFDLNADTYNRYLNHQVNPYEVTVVRFIGRGMEGFSDEILNVFEWMKLHPRIMPQEFEVHSMRSWDNFFWGVELGNLDRDLPDYVTDPLYWPEKGTPKKISVKLQTQRLTNALRITVAPKVPNTVVFLTPEMIDFKMKTEILVNGKRFQPANGFVESSTAIILEDARTRSDRLHPFWGRLGGSPESSRRR